MNKKILIVQPLLAHYRNSLFQELVNSDKFDITVMAGKQINNIKEIPTGSPRIMDNLNNKRIKIGGHMFIWQAGVVKYTLRTKPDIVVLTGVDPHIISNLWLSVICKLFLNIKVVWWGHADLDKKGTVGKFFRLFFFNLSAGVFSYNDGGKKNIQSLTSRGLKVESIKNCINEDEYGYNQQAFNNVVPQKKDRIDILFSGRLTKEKKLDILIEALTILKKKNILFKCIIIGNGAERAILETMIEHNQLHGIVELVGEKYNEECYPYFCESDLFVLPGKVGLSIIHGLSYGLPVITSNKIEIHSPEYEIIQPGYNGDFFEKLEPADLANKIMEWGYKMKSNERTAIRSQCVSSIVDGGYTPKDMSNKMIKFLSSLSN